MPKLIAFSEPSYSGTSQEFRSNDPDLTLNGDDFIIKSAIVLAGSWTLYDDVNSSGSSISLGEQGGPDADGTSNTATVHLDSNDLDNHPFNITYDGFVRSRKPEIAIQQEFSDWRKDPRDLRDNVSEIRMGTVKPNRSASITCSIWSQGGSPLTKLSIQKDGKNPDDFTISDINKNTLKPNGYTTFKITFKPKSKGLKRAAIHIISDDPNENPFDIKLTGSGSAP